MIDQLAIKPTLPAQSRAQRTKRDIGVSVLLCKARLYRQGLNRGKERHVPKAQNGGTSSVKFGGKTHIKLIGGQQSQITNQGPSLDRP